MMVMAKETYKEFEEFKRANPTNNDEERDAQFNKIKENALSKRPLTHGFNIYTPEGDLEVVGDSEYTYSRLDHLQPRRFQWAVISNLVKPRLDIGELIDEFSKKEITEDYTAADNLAYFVEALKENGHNLGRTIVHKGCDCDD